MKANEIDHVVIRVYDKNGNMRVFNQRIEDDKGVYLNAIRWLQQITSVV